VHVTVADGRSFVRSTDLRFRNIVISLVDTWAAASVGGMALSENGLYTVEAVRDYVEHLTSDGALVVNRWDGEFERLLALASAGLRAAGIHDPKAHLFACSSERSTALLVKREALSPAEIAELRAFCKRPFREVLAPDKPQGDLREAIMADPAAPKARTTTQDLSASTDDRPFFFYTVPPSKLWSVLRDTKKLATEQQGLATLALVLVVSSALALLCLVVPLAFRSKAASGLAPVSRPMRLRLGLFFSAIGLGFVLVEMSLVQHLTMFLGHPVYALSAVLTLLLASTGVGALLVSRTPRERMRAVASRRALLLALLLVVLALGVGPVLGKLVGLPFVGRLGVAALVLGPLGVLMGAQAPLGVSVTASRSPSLVPWCWGLNGFFSVIATSVAMLSAMNVGFSFLLLLAAVAYFVGAATIPDASEDRPSA
jgi:hypothetical protein